VWATATGWVSATVRGLASVSVTAKASGWVPAPVSASRRPVVG